jgi:hypothetical protein
VNLQRAALVADYRESQLDLVWKPTQAGDRFAIIDIEFEALSGSTDAQKRLEPARALHLTDEAIDFLLDRGNVSKISHDLGDPQGTALKKPARLFLSPQVELELVDGTRLHPTLTSLFPEISAWTPRKSKITSGFASAGQTDPAVIRFARGPEMTAALVQPHRKARVTLVYAVPPETKRATLRFYDCPPINVGFGQDSGH